MLPLYWRFLFLSTSFANCRQKGDFTMFEAGKKPREQLRMPQEAYVQIDQWVDYLSPDTYYWWRKFISWVDRTPSRAYECHVPYTLESVFTKLGVSQTTFYRKVKILWESGLIEIIEFEKSERKSQKPKNIIVYDYPFNNAEFEYKPLEKRRDWREDYESQSKLAGIKGAILKKEMHPPNFERVGETVDNSPELVDNYPPKNERVDPPNFERVTLPEMGANNISNNLLIPLNKSINDSNNTLSQARIDCIREILISYNFSAGERERIVELLLHKDLYLSVSKVELISQAKFMGGRTDIRDRAKYFVNGIEKNIGREFPKARKKAPETSTNPIPFYNWLEE